MSDVRIAMRKEFWRELMNSPEMDAALLAEAKRAAADSDSRVGSPSHPKNLKNPNFVAKTVTRHGASSPYLIGLVIAANPRSMWKARRDGVLHQ